MSHNSSLRQSEREWEHVFTTAMKRSTVAGMLRLIKTAQAARSGPLLRLPTFEDVIPLATDVYPGVDAVAELPMPGVHANLRAMNQTRRSTEAAWGVFMVPFRGRTPSPRLAAVIAVVLLAIAFIGMGEMLLRERQAALEAVTTSQSNLTLGLERDIMRSIVLYDLSLRTAVAGLDLVDPSMTAAAQNAILFDGNTAARYFRSILIADSAGRVIRDSGSIMPRVASVADRPFFAAHRSNAATGQIVELYLHGRISGQPYLSLSRRMTAPDGSFQGTVSGGLDLAYFDEIFSHYTLPTDCTVALVGYDGRLIAGFPRRDGMAGRNVNGAGIVERARLDDVASFETTSVVDGITRIATVRRLGDLPFFVAVGVPSQAVYSQWQWRAGMIGAGLVAFAALSCLLLGALFRELGRRRLAERVAVEACDSARASERRLVTYVDQLADGILALRRTPEGEFIYERVNAAAADMLDIRAEDAIGRRPREVWPASVADLVEQRLAKCVAADGPIHYEHHHKGRERSRVVRFALAPVREVPGGPVTLLLASLRDVTEIVGIEAQLRQAQRMEAVGQLTAGVAHDFNNMLQAQLGALQIIMKRVEEIPGTRKYVDIAIKAGERGAALTQSLLSFSRKQQLAPCAVPVEDMLKRIECMLSSTLGPRIELRIKTDAEQCAPFADVGQLESAVLNLALNARDAMENGGVLTIEARAGTAADTAPPGVFPAECFVLALADTGVGMDADVAAKACEPFFTTKDVGKGSGLGLSMVQGFVQQSDGAMRIASVPGHGTRVELWLPLARIGTPHAEQDARCHPGPDHSPSPSAPHSLAVTAA